MSLLLEQLKRHEGLRLKPYKCTSGRLTIGYGRNLEDKGISEQEALLMLRQDVDSVYRDLYANIPDVMHNISDKRGDVLINMAFNLGVNGLLKFKKLLAALKAGDYDEAAEQMLDSVWANQVGNRAVELSEQMRTGVYK